MYHTAAASTHTHTASAPAHTCSSRAPGSTPHVAHSLTHYKGDIHGKRCFNEPANRVTVLFNTQTSERCNHGVKMVVTVHLNQRSALISALPPQNCALVFVGKSYWLWCRHHCWLPLLGDYTKMSHCYMSWHVSSARPTGNYMLWHVFTVAMFIEADEIGAVLSSFIAVECFINILVCVSFHLWI